MHALLSNPNWRFIIAFGASMGVGHALFRSLTENLGPIVGLLVFLPSIALIAAGISLLLAYAVKRSNQVAK
jgi:hypothetical protein